MERPIVTEFQEVLFPSDGHNRAYVRDFKGQSTHGYRVSLPPSCPCLVSASSISMSSLELLFLTIADPLLLFPLATFQDYLL